MQQPNPGCRRLMLEALGASPVQRYKHQNLVKFLACQRPQAHAFDTCAMQVAVMESCVSAGLGTHQLHRDRAHSEIHGVRRMRVCDSRLIKLPPNIQ